jgi:hypothetical protein
MVQTQSGSSLLVLPGSYILPPYGDSSSVGVMPDLMTAVAVPTLQPPRRRRPWPIGDTFTAAITPRRPLPPTSRISRTAWPVSSAAQVQNPSKTLQFSCEVKS